MRNSKQAGKIKTAIAPVGGVVSGQLYKVGNLIGVATGSFDAGQEYELDLHGAVKIPNTDGLAEADGELVGYDSAANKIVAAGAGDFDVDLFAELKATDAEAVVLLPKGGF